MEVIVNVHGLQNGNHGIPSRLQGSGEGGVRAGAVKYYNSGAAKAVTLQPPRGDPEIAEEWTTAQHAILEESLKKYESDLPVIRYAKLGLQIPTKKIIDVAFRCTWMTKKETRKRRNDDSLPPKSKNKKEKATDLSAETSCHLPVQPNDTPNSMSMLHIDNDEDISYKAIGGPTRLLENTAGLFNHISWNLTNFQIIDNIGLFFQARNNIIEVMNKLNVVPLEMKPMPPLPFMLEELANSILSKQLCIVDGVGTQTYTRE